MNINTVIQEIKETLDILQEQRFDDSFIDAGGLLQIESENMKLQALQEKAERENPQPLTLEELRGMDGEPVWARISTNSHFEWRIVEVDKNPDESTPLLSFTDLSCYLPDNHYGTHWLAYRYPPKGE